MGKNKIVFTLSDLQKTKCASLNPFLFEDQKKVAKKEGVKIPIQKGSKTKNWIALQLSVWCKANNLLLVPELVFHPVRLWRFDWAVMDGSVTPEQIKAKAWSKESQVCAIEYEGIFSEKSGHTTLGGYIKDTEKYNEAVTLGWHVVRTTGNNYKSLFSFLTPILEQYKNKI